MPDRRRPLPDSDEVQDLRANERLVRWASVLIALMVVLLVILLALRWVLEPAS